MRRQTRAERAGAPSLGPPLCPHCHGRLVRVRRRAVDRLVSIVYEVRRFRCIDISCQWEGNVRQRRE